MEEQADSPLSGDRIELNDTRSRTFSVLDANC